MRLRLLFVVEIVYFRFFFKLCLVIRFHRQNYGIKLILTCLIFLVQLILPHHKSLLN
jgi:hypothetical protein